MLRAEDTSEQSILDMIRGGRDTSQRAFAQVDSDIRELSQEVITQSQIILDDVEENVRGVATAIKSALP